MDIEMSGYQYREAFEATFMLALTQEGKVCSETGRSLLARFLDLLTVEWTRLLMDLSDTEESYECYDNSQCDAMLETSAFLTIQSYEDFQEADLYQLAASQDDIRLLFRRPLTTDDLLHCFIHSILCGFVSASGPLIMAIHTGTTISEAESVTMAASAVFELIAEARAFSKRSKLGKDEHCVYLTARRNKPLGATFTMDDIRSWFRDGRCVIASQRYLICSYRSITQSCTFNDSVDDRRLIEIMKRICSYNYLRDVSDANFDEVRFEVIPVSG